MRAPDDSADVIDGLVAAYRAGLFPMASPATGQIQWYTADPRGVLPLTPDDGLHVPRSVERAIRNRGFLLRTDTAFEPVMRACAPARSEDDEPWINDVLIGWYTRLHHAGRAHSLEAWRPAPGGGPDVLVGGIYGVAIGAAFFGESMFCRPRPRRPDGSRHPLDGADASKVCLVVLTRWLAASGFTLFDTQMVTDHVARFGGREIPAAAYARRLRDAVAAPDRWRPLPSPA